MKFKNIDKEISDLAKGVKIDIKEHSVDIDIPDPTKPLNILEDLIRMKLIAVQLNKSLSKDDRVRLECINIKGDSYVPFDIVEYAFSQLFEWYPDVHYDSKKEYKDWKLYLREFHVALYVNQYDSKYMNSICSILKDETKTELTNIDFI